MTAPVFLALFILAVSVSGNRVMARATWPNRAPALGIVAWQALTIGTALAVIFAGLALAMPRMHLTVDLAQLLEACAEELRHQYGTPAGALMSGAGAVLSLGVLARFVVLMTTTALADRRDRHRHLAGLALITDPSAGSDVTLVEHDVPVVYCLPGRNKRVVVTRGAQQVLSERELAGVLVHERAHLRARHHLAVAVASVLSRTFFGLGLFKLAQKRISELAEMHADDAANADQRRDLASALLHLTGSATPAGALGVGGSTALARIVRLSRPQEPLPRLARLPILGLAAGLVLSPVLLAMIPAGVALAADCCGAALVPLS